MLELSNHKKYAVAVGAILCVPLVFILWFSVVLLTGSAEFKDISEVKLTLPDGSVEVFTDSEDVSFYAGMLERASVVEKAVRDVTEEDALLLQLDNTAYRLYPSLSLSGCMATDGNGTIRLLSSEDAAKLVVRAEMEYLYDSHRLPTLQVFSGDKTYGISPDRYTWQYKKADGVYYADQTTVTSAELITCNIFSDFASDISFSTTPSSYSFVVHHYANGTEGYELPVTSLAGLQFSQDTVLSVEITAKWSQASNSEQYGEAHYYFLVLYDVPAEVELVGADGADTLTVPAGGYVLLRALYTNANEDLSVRANFRTDNLQFYYDDRTGTSYAFLPVDSENASGNYELTVTSGDTVRNYTFTVTDGASDEIISVPVSEEDYQNLLSPERLQAVEDTLASLRAQSDGTPLLHTDLAFGNAVSGEVLYEYGSSVLFGNENTTDLHTLRGVVYGGGKGDEVEAVQSGVCVFAGELGAAGNTVVIDHGCGVFSYYFGLEELLAEVGEEISRSEEIGTVGSSGYTNGNGDPYLCFALSVGDVYINPIG